jgi:transposase-like protein
MPAGATANRPAKYYADDEGGVFARDPALAKTEGGEGPADGNGKGGTRADGKGDAGEVSTKGDAAGGGSSNSGDAEASAKKGNKSAGSSGSKSGSGAGGGNGGKKGKGGWREDGTWENFPLRQRTGTAAFHMSKDAVDFGSEDLEKLTEREAVMLMADAMWGSTTEMTCPHCNTLDTHYWSAKELRWKCKCCGKRFSVTSGTVLADHKLSLRKILKMVFAWANGASGKPALQLRRDWKVSYTAAYCLVQKLREGLLRGLNGGVLCGVVEMDGADVQGKRYREKRNKPLGGAHKPGPKIPAHLLKEPKETIDPETGEIMGPPKPHKYDKTAKQPEDRRLLLVMRQRAKSAGKGAVATRVGIALRESAATVTAFARNLISAESRIMSDEDPAYAAFGKLFAQHGTINHSKAYSGPDGVNNNQAESFNRRMRRGFEGVYLSVSTKYTMDYACEMAWREDVRRLSTGKKLRHVLKTALSVGLSQWFRGYSHGHNRTEELLIEGDREVKTRGKPKGWTPKPPR